MKRNDSGATLHTRGPMEQTAQPGEAKLKAPRPGRLTSTKVNERHLARLAIVYVRQSTAAQMIEHRESLDRQYALTDYALALG